MSGEIPCYDSSRLIAKLGLLLDRLLRTHISKRSTIAGTPRFGNSSSQRPVKEIMTSICKPCLNLHVLWWQYLALIHSSDKNAKCNSSGCQYCGGTDLYGSLLQILLYAEAHKTVSFLKRFFKIFPQISEFCALLPELLLSVRVLSM